MGWSYLVTSWAGAEMEFVLPKLHLYRWAGICAQASNLSPSVSKVGLDNIVVGYFFCSARLRTLKFSRSRRFNPLRYLRIKAALFAFPCGDVRQCFSRHSCEQN